MQSPALYAGANGLQRREAARLLPPLLATLDWRADHRLLDIGCGSGDVLTGLLLPQLPRFGPVLGVDISEEMVQYAGRTYGSDQLQFRRADIGSETAAADIGATFHRVFSLFCLHWVHHQSIALKNIHDLLEPGGHAILVFMAKNKIFDMYEKVADMPRWKSYMADWQSFVSPYQRTLDPVREFCQLATAAELKVRSVTAPWSTFEYRSQAELESALSAVSPFVTRVPDRDRRAFLQDCVGAVLRSVGVDGRGAVPSRYQLIVAHLARENGHMAVDGKQDSASGPPQQ